MKIVWNSWSKKTTTPDDIKALEGEVVSSVTGLAVGSEEIVFTTESGKAIKLYHKQDCCESVAVEDLEGSDSNIVGGKVWLAEEVEGKVKITDWGDQMYTFYKIETDKGGVWIRWSGESNGYYSISVYVLGGAVLSEDEQ